MGPEGSQTEALVQSASMPSELSYGKENASIPYSLETAGFKVVRLMNKKGEWQDAEAWSALYADAKFILGSIEVERRMQGLVDLLGEISNIAAALRRDLEWLNYYARSMMADETKREMISIVEKYLRWDDIRNDEQGKMVKALLRLSIVGDRDKQNLVQHFVYKCYKFPVFGQHFSGFYITKKQAPNAGMTVDYPDPQHMGAHVFRLARSFNAAAFIELVEASVPVLDRVLGEGDDRVFVPDFIHGAQGQLLSLPTPESVKARRFGFKRQRVIR